MITKENKEEKICSFYASDFHLEMIILPYINKKLEKNKKVIVVTEENLTDSIKILISKVNLEESRKRKLLNINWDNNYIEKIEKIKENIKSNQEMSIIINGKEEFVEKINNIISEEKTEKIIDIVDCYRIEDIKDHMQEIAAKHEKVLNTLGIQEI
jgi:hypothetical protein